MTYFHPWTLREDAWSDEHVPTLNNLKQTKNTTTQQIKMRLISNNPNDPQKQEYKAEHMASNTDLTILTNTCLGNLTSSSTDKHLDLLICWLLDLLVVELLVVWVRRLKDC